MSTRVANEFNGTITRIVIFGIYTWQLVNYIGKGSSGCNGKGDLPISQSNTGITSKPDWRLIVDVCAPKRMKHTDFNDLIVWKTIGWIAMQVCTDTHTPPLPVCDGFDDLLTSYLELFIFRSKLKFGFFYDQIPAKLHIQFLTKVLLYFVWC